MAHDSGHVLTRNPIISYLDQILMEEDSDADDDARCMQLVDDVSYQATLSGFYELLGQHPQPHHSCVVDSAGGNDACDAHPLPCKGAAEQHVKVVGPSHGFYNSPFQLSDSGASWISTLRPCLAHAHRPQQQRADVGFTLKHDSAPWNTTPLPGPQEMRHGMSNSGSLLKFYGLNEARVRVSFGCDTAAPHNPNPNNFNYGVAVVNRLGDHSCMQQQEQGDDISKRPLTDAEFFSKLFEVEVLFEDFRLKDVYTDLYVGKLTSSARSSQASRDIEQYSRREKKTLAVGKGRETGRHSTLESLVFVDVREALVSCAQAVESGNARRVKEILQELHQVHGASANGTSSQRIAHFFGEALAARMRGTTEHECRAMSRKMPSAVTLLHATTKVAFELIPHVKIIHYYANQSILKAADGASRLHIVDYGLAHGVQWPCLISALADRKGGPPLLVITGIEFSQPGVNPGRRLEKSGQQLAAYAKMHNVPFQYHGIVCNKLEDLDVASLNLHKDEVLVVNCIMYLGHLADESVNSTLDTSPRQELLTFMCNINPHLLLIAVTNATYNSPFFVSRFREAVHHFSNVFDMLATLWGDTPLRCMLEKSHYYRQILNVVGCEGADRVDRPETYKQWHVRITKAGFEQLPIPPPILSRSRSYAKQHYHKDFLIHDDIGKGWMLMGWKGCTALAVSAWKPSLVQTC